MQKRAILAILGHFLPFAGSDLKKLLNIFSIQRNLRSLF